MLLLGLMGSGEYGEITEIREHGAGRQGSARSPGPDGKSRLETMGIRVGKRVEMLRSEGGGPLLIKIGESRIAVSRGMAMKILVRRIEL